LNASGGSFGEILAHLHAPEVLLRLERAGITLPPPLPQSTPDRLRGSMFPLLDSARMEQAERLVAMVEQILAAPSSTAFLHGDFHGHNLLVSDDDLQVLGRCRFRRIGCRRLRLTTSGICPRSPRPWICCR